LQQAATYALVGIAFSAFATTVLHVFLIQ